MTDGFSALAAVLTARIKGSAKQTVSSELATVNADYSLSLETVSEIALPQSDYYINTYLSGDNAIQPGNIVLVCWTSGNRPVVLAVVAKA